MLYNKIMEEMKDMTDMDNVSQAQTLLAELDKYDNAYFNGQPLISDDAYDQLWFKLRDLMQEDKAVERVVQEHGLGVGSPLERENCKTRHTEFMPSLDKLNQADERFAKRLQAFETKVNKLRDTQLHKPRVSGWLVQPKLDGLSVIFYKRGAGHSPQFVTRGGGVAGEDVTDVMLRIPRMREMVDKLPDDLAVIVRGELVCKANDITTESSAALRSVAAGVLRSHDPAQCDVDRLCFVPFEILGEFGRRMTNTEQLQWLAEYFDAARLLGMTRSGATLDEAEAIITTFADELTDNERFATTADEGWLLGVDGLVIKPADEAANDLAVEEGHHRSNQLAIKFRPKRAIAVIASIEHKLSAQGKITPVAVFTEPAMISGKQISKATLGSWAKMLKTGATPGAKISLALANDVIPKVDAVIEKGKPLPQPADTHMDGAHLFTNSLPVIAQDRLADLRAACKALARSLQIKQLHSLLADNSLGWLSEQVATDGFASSKLTDAQRKAVKVFKLMLEGITPEQFISFLKIKNVTTAKIKAAEPTWQGLTELYKDDNELSELIGENYLTNDAYAARRVDDQRVLAAIHHAKCL